MHYAYLEALILRRLKRPREAGRAYQKILGSIQRAENSVAAKAVWGMLHIIRSQNKRLIEEKLLDFRDMIELQNVPTRNENDFLLGERLPNNTFLRVNDLGSSRE